MEQRLIDANELISRKSAIEELEEFREILMDEDSMSCDFAADIVEQVIDNYIEKLPTVDPIEHGEWTETGDEVLDNTYSGRKCSLCGYVFCGNQMNYCPGCGAKMDKEELK